MNLSRMKIVNGNYLYPTDMITIKPTKHYSEQLKKRCVGLDCIPTKVRVTKDNIHSGKSKDGVHLDSVVVRINYTSSKYLFICLNPYDGGGKSMWFEKRKKNEEGNRENSEQAVRADGSQEDLGTDTGERIGNSKSEEQGDRDPLV